MGKVAEIGFIGLGKMGLNMAKRILTSNQDFSVLGYNKEKEALLELKKAGGRPTESVSDLISRFESERKVVWMMLPAGDVTESVFQELLLLLNKDDIIIDGANSNFHDTLRRYEEAEKKGINMLDVGVSGGIVAKDSGYPMMIGGGKEAYEYCIPIFQALGKENSFNLVGDCGAGHYVKMVHNAIEYGMMQAIAEGFDLLENGRIKNLDLLNISKIWNNGTIIDSFLMKMVQNALEKDSKLEYLKPYVDDSGEGRWSAIEALEYNIPFVVNSYALNARYISRDEDSYAFKLLSAMRNEFGGHPVKK